MSSNESPKSPESTPAKMLTQQMNERKPYTEEKEEPEVTKMEVRSLFASIPSIPQKPETSDEPVIKSEELNSFESEVSGIDESAESLSEKTRTDSIKYYEGGPWEIIKYTGYVSVLLWAVFTAAISGGAAYFFTPTHGAPWTWITLGVLGFMTGIIAAVDKKTHLIKNQHTILTAVLTAPLAVVTAFSLGSWNLLLGVISVVLVFGVFIFLVYKVNFGSGGDIKFSPVPAFALGVVNPLISALWLFYALIITVVLLLVRKKKSTSFGEGMALSLPLAIASVYGLYSMSGLPYMEPVM